MTQVSLLCCWLNLQGTSVFYLIALFLTDNFHMNSSPMQKKLEWFFKKYKNNSSTINNNNLWNKLNGNSKDELSTDINKFKNIIADCKIKTNIPSQGPIIQDNQYKESNSQKNKYNQSFINPIQKLRSMIIESRKKRQIISKQEIQNNQQKQQSKLMDYVPEKQNDYAQTEELKEDNDQAEQKGEVKKSKRLIEKAERQKNIDQKYKQNQKNRNLQTNQAIEIEARKWKYAKKSKQPTNISVEEVLTSIKFCDRAQIRFINQLQLLIPYFDQGELKKVWISSAEIQKISPNWLIFYYEQYI